MCRKKIVILYLDKKKTKMPNHPCRRKTLATRVIYLALLLTFSVKLERFEIPQRLTLVTEQWTPETELVTASLKLKRKNITVHYRQELDAMYKK